MDSTGIFQGIFNQSTLNVDTQTLIISGLTDNKVIGSIGGILTNNVSTDGLDEGKTNQYFTTARARAAFSSISPINIAPAGVISLGYSGNLRLNGTSLDTIQDIQTSSSPQFARLLNSSLGTYSTLIGTNTGTAFTGDRCVLIGDSVMQAASAAQQTTAIGNSAAAFATGDFNTACGANAGFGLSTGTVNTVLGCNAGRGATPLTTGSYNVLLGAGANTSSGSALNEIVIGYGVGAGNNTAKIYASGGLVVSNLTAGVLKSSASGLITSNATTDDLVEGKTNQYFTTSRARTALVGGTSITYYPLTGQINTSQALDTTSSPTFAGLTIGSLSGVIKASAGVLSGSATTDDLTEGKTNLYFTNARAQAAITATIPISITTGVISLGYNTNNLRITLSQLNTIQDISPNSQPQFTRLADSSIGSFNSLIGTSSGASLTTGSKNTGVGYESLASCSTGENNVTIGFTSGYSITTGSNNVTIGNSAGRGVSPLTTGSNNTYIGTASYPSSASPSNEIVIGAMTGNGSNTCSIYAPSGLYVSNLITGVLKSNASGLITSNATTDDLLEGKTNLYFTTSRARGAFSAGTGISIAAGVITNTAPATITSITGTTNQINVSGTGALTLSTPQDIGTGSSVQFARLINSSVGTRNLLLGTNAGAAITTGVDAVAIGNVALSTLSTAINCTAVGSRTLSNCNANNNTAVGFRASETLTSGFQNTTVGAFAGAILTTGKYNSLFGMSAGGNISTGDTNFCLGLNAGYSITTSSDNIAIGAYTMAKNLNPITTTYGRNIAIGHYASHSLAGTPENNITLGYQSMWNATSCSDNICIGTNAGNSITTGGGNIAIGGSSLSTGGTLTAGQGFNIGIGIASNLYVSAGATNNIGLGAYSNFNTSTGTNNISIGPYTQASTATGSNQITISTNGTSGTPISGKGNDTAFIDARNGLYYYSPAYGHFKSTNNTSNLMYWNTTLLSQNISVSNQTVTFALAGLYEVNFSGSVQANSGGTPNGQLFINGALYSPSQFAFYNSNPAGSGFVCPLSFMIQYRFTAGSTMYMATGNCQGNISIPSYLSIKYLGQ